MTHQLSDALFEPQRVGQPRPNAVTEIAFAGNRLSTRPICHSQEFDASALSINLPSGSFVTVSGSREDRLYRVSAVEAISTSRRIATTGPSSLIIDGGPLSVRSDERPEAVYLEIIAPANRAVTAIGRECYLELLNLTGAIDVMASNCRIAVLRCGDVAVIGGAGSHVVWSGSHGDVSLKADLSVALRFADNYDGHVVATANGDINASIPPDFRSSFVIDVPESSAIHLTDHMAKRAAVKRAGSRRVVTSGCSEPATLQMTAVHGSVVFIERSAP